MEDQDIINTFVNDQNITPEEQNIFDIYEKKVSVIDDVISSLNKIKLDFITEENKNIINKKQNVLDGRMTVKILNYLNNKFHYTGLSDIDKLIGTNCLYGRDHVKLIKLGGNNVVEDRYYIITPKHLEDKKTKNIIEYLINNGLLYKKG